MAQVDVYEEDEAEPKCQTELHMCVFNASSLIADVESYDSTIVLRNGGATHGVLEARCSLEKLQSFLENQWLIISRIYYFFEETRTMSEQNIFYCEKARDKKW